MFLTNSLYIIFLIASFSTALVRLCKSTGTVFNLSLTKSSVSDIELAKSAFLENFNA